jgi:tRNA(Ile)-lysidine synthase TilS/MesJ
MKCTRCREKAVVQLRHHHSNFCRDCFLLFFERQVEKAIRRESMFAPEDEILVAVSGGKDSLALWDILVRLGYRTTGLHLALGIGAYSTSSTERTQSFARERELRLITVALADEGAAVPELAAATRRPACAACGTAKRHFFDKIAADHGFRVLATGHNLDDEAARLLGNVLHWQAVHLAKQSPVLESTHEKFARKVKPLFRVTEYETAVYAFLRRIDYVIDECPNSVGATQLVYKDVLNRLEAASPGTKLTFVQEFLRTGRPAFRDRAPEAPEAGGVEDPASERAEGAALAPADRGGTCNRCGMPAWGTVCSFCNLLESAQRRRHSAPDRSTAR